MLDEIDGDRRFILSYFMSDDTISLYEPAIKNSGITGGKFLERTRYANELVREIVYIGI